MYQIHRVNQHGQGYKVAYDMDTLNDARQWLAEKRKLHAAQMPKGYKRKCRYVGKNKIKVLKLHPCGNVCQDNIYYEIVKV